MQQNTSLDKVLIVDDDPDVRSLLREQVLDSRRFVVFEAGDGAEGLAQIRQNSPDLIILDLVMPGLSGADFLVALKSQGFTGPVIVSTKRGSEAQAIDAFRLGATDMLTKPIREAEALRTIEHGLEEVRLRRERRELMEQLQRTNKQLESRIKALTTLSAIGKSVTGMLNLEALFERVLEAAVAMTEADHATLILKDEESGRSILRAGRNLTLVMQERLGEPVNDGVANLVMTSGEPLIASGENLKQFKFPSDIQAVVYAPMSIQNKPIGVLTVGNHRKRRQFDENAAYVLDILAGYGAIAIANARLFNALEQRARTLEQAYNALKSRDSSRDKVIAGVSGMRAALVELQADLQRLNAETFPSKVRSQLGGMNQRITNLLEAVNGLGR